MEAITSRTLLLAAVGKPVNHANQRTLYLTPLYGKEQVLMTLSGNIGATLQHVRAAAEQFTQADRWGLLVRYVCNRIAPVIGPFRPADALRPTKASPPTPPPVRIKVPEAADPAQPGQQRHRCRTRAHELQRKC